MSYRPIIRLFYCSSFSLLLVSGCRYAEGFEPHQHTTMDGKATYTVAFPDYMGPSSSGTLNPQATAQYANYFRNIYAIVLDTAVTETTAKPDSLFHYYVNIETSQLVSILARPQLIDSTNLTVDGHPAVRVSYTGTVGREQITERIYYDLTFVQTPHHYYQLTVWVWDQWRQKYKDDIDQMVKSFQVEEKQGVGSQRVWSQRVRSLASQ